MALVVKNPPANAGDVRHVGLIPGSGRSPRNLREGKEMATHSSVLAWRIPWTEDPGGLQSMGSQRVGHDWSDLARTHHFTWPNVLYRFPQVQYRVLRCNKLHPQGAFSNLAVSFLPPVHPLSSVPLLLTTHSSYMHMHRDADIQPYFRTKTYMEIGI